MNPVSSDMKKYKLLEYKTLVDFEKAINEWAKQSYVLEDIRVWETVTGQKNDIVTRLYLGVLSKRV